MGSTTNARRQVSIICALLALSIHGALAKDFEVKTFNANMQGELLVLDIGTMYFQGNHPFGPAISSVDECKAECNKMPNCNGFTFCNKTEGCGTGCDAWAAKKPKIVYLPNGPIVDPVKTKLPIQGFGPNNGGCSWQNKDVWQEGVCTLKVVANPSSPKFYSQNAAEGWVSGTINRPASCKGFSTNVCSGCLKSSDPKACFDCARKTKQISYNRGEKVRASGCVACYNSTMGAFKNRCLQCVLKGKECFECAFARYAKQCFECYKNEAPKKGSAYCDRCTNDQIGSEAAAIRCVHKCLPAVRKYRCQTFGQQDCIQDYSDVCPVCSKLGKQYDTCVKCSTTFLGNEKCTYCGSMARAGQRARCFKCAMKASVTGWSWCSDCLSYSDVKNREECLACVENPETKTESKDRCATCSWDAKTAKEQTTCYNCLAKNPSNVQGTCFG